MASVLSTENLSVDFGGVHALVRCSLEVEEHQLVGLIGPNGAGKTTFIDAVSGFVNSKGAVRLRGTDVSNFAPDRRASLGLARTWQSGDLFDDLTVRENLEVTLGRPSAWHALREIITGGRIANRVVTETLDFFGLSDIADEIPTSVTQAQRKLVGVARAIAMRPVCTLLDEPAAGLDTAESMWLGEQLQRIRDSGVSLLLVDHDMGLVLSICDFVYVLDFGQLIAAGTPRQVRSDRRVVEAYLGRSLTEFGLASEL